LSGSGVGASVEAEQYGKDIITLKTLLSQLYENFKLKPLLLAPGGFYEQKWYSQLLQVSGTSAIDAITHHIYNLGGGKCNTLLL
jgi:heparanase